MKGKIDEYIDTLWEIVIFKLVRYEFYFGNVITNKRLNPNNILI